MNDNKNIKKDKILRNKDLGIEKNPECQIGSDRTCPLQEIEKTFPQCQNRICEEYQDRNYICQKCYNKWECEHICIIGLTITRK